MPERVPVFEEQKFSLPEDLYGYQKEDVDKLLTDGSWLNFSEMGVGKTPEALAVCELLKCRRVLVVCPNSLRWEWARQIKEWTGEDAGVSLRAARKRLDNFFLKPTKYYIINYESVRITRYREILVGLPWDCIILDEGHKLKNYRTLQTRGVAELCRAHTKSKLLILTGSPIINNPGDLFSLLCMVRPDQYKPAFKREFIDNYCYYNHTRHGIHIYGSKNLESLRKETNPFTIRRTKKEVLPFLPDKYYRRPELALSPEQRKVYDQMEGELFVMLDSGEPLHAPGVLAQLTRLRQLNLEPRILGVDAPSSKTEFLDDLIDSFIDEETSSGNGQKLVVFSCFAKYIYYLSLKYSKISHIRLTGEENAEKRAISIARFQSDPDIKLALGTIQAAGEGITLTAASNVVLMDLWWSPATNSQAIDRLHRIGQKNAVQVIIPTNQDTIDQSLHKILRRKEEYAAGYFSDQSIITETIQDRKGAK